MFHFSKSLPKVSKTAQYAEMNQIGSEFTELAGDGEGESAVNKFIELVTCQPTWTQFHFDAMDFVARKGGLANMIINPLKKAAENEPENATLHYILGLFYQSIAHLDVAEEHYLKAIQLRKNNAVAYHNLGTLYYMQGDREGAIKAWETSIKLDAQLAEPHFALALMLGNLGKTRKSIKHFQQFIELAYPGLEGYKQNAAMQIQLMKSGD
jgi:tetratricopeptide (TPR) repeat protein